MGIDYGSASAIAIWIVSLAELPTLLPPLYLPLIPYYTPPAIINTTGFSSPDSKVFYCYNFDSYALELVPEVLGGSTNTFLTNRDFLFVVLTGGVPCITKSKTSSSFCYIAIFCPSVDKLFVL